jgi:hypothetical protein
MNLRHGRLANRRRFKGFTITDLRPKEIPVIEVDASIGGKRVCRILDRLFVGRPSQETIALDNRPESSGMAFDARPLSAERSCTSFNLAIWFKMHVLRASPASFQMSV